VDQRLDVEVHHVLVFPVKLAVVAARRRASSM
jgi:hypothetical protein